MRYLFSAARGESLMKNAYQVGVIRAGHTFSMDRRYAGSEQFQRDF